MKAQLRLSCAAALVLLCTACGDSTEIDRLAIVSMTGIDLGANENSIIGSAQIVRPSQLGTSGGGAPTTATGSPEAYIVESAAGVNLSDTLDEVRHHLSRRLFMGHRRVIVLGEAYAKHGVSPLIDEIVRNPQTRLRAYPVVAYHATAQEVLKLPYILNRLPADAIVELEEQRLTAQVDARSFIERYEGAGDPVTLGVVIQPGATPQTMTDTNFTLDKIAVFRSDKLVGWLDGRQAKGFLWLDGQVKSLVETVKIPHNSGYISARADNIRARRQVTFNGKQLRLDSKIQAQFDVMENTTGLNLEDPENISKLQEALTGNIRSEVKSTMYELQHTYHADSFGFGDITMRKYPAIWRQLQPRWHAYYSKLPVEFNMKIRVRNSGLISSSLPRS